MSACTCGNVVSKKHANLQNQLPNQLQGVRLIILLSKQVQSVRGVVWIVNNMDEQDQEYTAPMLPLRNANKQAAISAFALSPAPPPGANKWRGSLLGCCSGCDSYAWGSCLLSWHLPCIAFGLNMKRALNLWAWCQAVIFLVLLVAFQWFYAWTYASVKLYCPPSLPVNVQRHDYQVVPCLGENCKGFDIIDKAASPGSFGARIYALVPEATADHAQNQFQYASTAGVHHVLSVKRPAPSFRTTCAMGCGMAKPHLL
ncbi:hypothetical protein ABBQ38_015285 [Trebouxia sp. C0009 RCD-2024]